MSPPGKLDYVSPPLESIARALVILILLSVILFVPCHAMLCHAMSLPCNQHAL